ncbi:MAG: endonuclease [Gammaproteobacteria bacterium]|nr:endonuclease [Gammaproteobacteria bacterium]
MADLKNIDGHFFPAAHPGWGAFAEELFHYTSRYYKTTEAFLGSLAGLPRFSMTGYSAARLSDEQRSLLGAVLASPPERETALAVMSVVEYVCSGSADVDERLADTFAPAADALPPADLPEHPVHFTAEGEGDVDPLDPFMSLADRLLMPVALRDRHVEVSLRELAKHLQSPNSTLRTNLHNAIIALHNAGYVLRNHPHLTHCEAEEISRRRN